MLKAKFDHVPKVWKDAVSAGLEKYIFSIKKSEITDVSLIFFCSGDLTEKFSGAELLFLELLLELSHPIRVKEIQFVDRVYRDLNLLVENSDCVKENFPELAETDISFVDDFEKVKTANVNLICSFGFQVFCIGRDLAEATVNSIKAKKNMSRLVSELNNVQIFMFSMGLPLDEPNCLNAQMYFSGNFGNSPHAKNYCNV